MTGFWSRIRAWAPCPVCQGFCFLSFNPFPHTCLKNSPEKSLSREACLDLELMNKIPVRQPVSADRFTMPKKRTGRRVISAFLSLPKLVSFQWIGIWLRASECPETLNPIFPRVCDSSKSVWWPIFSKRRLISQKNGINFSLKHVSYIQSASKILVLLVIYDKDRERNSLLHNVHIQLVSSSTWAWNTE